MGPLNLLGTLLVSVAVIIAVVGQFITIMDYLRVPRPNVHLPFIALLGAMSFIFLLSSIVAINIVPGTTDIVTANSIAEWAIRASLVPYVLAVLVPFLPITERRHSARGFVLLLIGVVLGIFIFPFRYLLPPDVPLLVGALFTLVPIVFSMVGTK
jgi:hypothetical protein